MRPAEGGEGQGSISLPSTAFPDATHTQVSPKSQPHTAPSGRTQVLPELRLDSNLQQLVLKQDPIVLAHEPGWGRRGAQDARGACLGPTQCSPPVPIPSLIFPMTHLFSSSSASGMGGPMSSGPGLQVGKAARWEEVGGLEKTQAKGGRQSPLKGQNPRIHIPRFPQRTPESDWQLPLMGNRTLVCAATPAPCQRTPTFTPLQILASAAHQEPLRKSLKSPSPPWGQRSAPQP